MLKIKVQGEDFLRVHKTTKGRKEYICEACGRVIPKGTQSFILHMHMYTSRSRSGRACSECVRIYESKIVTRQVDHEYSPDPYRTFLEWVKVEV